MLQGTSSDIQPFLSCGLVHLARFWVKVYCFIPKKIFFSDDLNRGLRIVSEKKAAFQPTLMSKFENPEGEAGAVSPGRDGPLNTGVFGARLSKPFLMPSGKDGKSNSAVLCSDPPGAGASARMGASYQGDLHMSPLFQVNSSASVLDGWIELVQKREKKENGFKRQFNCSPEEPSTKHNAENLRVPFLFCMTSWFDLFSEANLFPFFFNNIDPPACSVASNYMQPVECQMSPLHQLTGAPMGNALRHNRLTIMVTEKQEQGVSNSHA